MTSNTQYKSFRSWATTSACCVALIHGLPAVAQEAPSQTSADREVVVVTGTNIRGTEAVGSSVQVIDEAILAESGKSTAADFLREIPINFAGGVANADNLQSSQDAGSGNSNLGAGQGVNLRGLGALSTLVLVNGRRVATSGQFGDFVDISNIPAVAIGQMEILQDGASAVYGSDAVGGVVNFILKREAERPITTIRAGTTTQGGGTDLLFSHLQPFNWADGNAVVAVEYQSRDEISATLRDPYSNGSDFSSLGGVNWQRFTGHYSPTTNLFFSNSGGVSGNVAGYVPPGSNANLTNADIIRVTDGIGTTTNVYNATDIVPQSERYSIYAAFDQALSDTIELFGDARYTKRDTELDAGFYVLTSQTLPSTSPFYIADIDPALTNPDGSIPFIYQFDDQPFIRTSSVDSYSFTGGARFDLLKDWQLETALTYSLEDQNRLEIQPRSPNTTDPDFMTCALGHVVPQCAGIDAIPFNPLSTEPLTDAQLAQYFGYENLDFESEVYQASAKLDGTAFTLPAGEVKFATGLDFRREGMEGFARINTIAPTPQEGPYTRTERDAIAAFAEVLVPLHETLQVSLAGRYEEFDADYGSQYDDFNPKIGIDFEPVPGLTFKGSWGTSFHAPPMRFENNDPQPLPGGNVAFVTPFGRTGPCDSPLVDFHTSFGINGLGEPGDVGAQCTFTVMVVSGGAGPGILKPEEAETFTLGFDYEPEAVPGLRFGLNYFDIEVTDRIQRIQSGTLNAILAEYFATNGGGPLAGALVPRPDVNEVQAILDSDKFLGVFGPPFGVQFGDEASDVAMIVMATQFNIAALQEKGFDFNLSYDVPIGPVDTTFFVNGTYITEYKTQGAPGQAFDDVLGRYSSFGSPVDLRSRQGVRFTSGAWDGSLAVNYVSDYVCPAGVCFAPDATTGAPVPSPNDIKIDSWVTTDLSVGYDLSDLEYGIADGLRIGFNVTNLFDEDPPFLDGAEGTDDNIPTSYDPANHTIIGRTVALTLTKSW